MCVVSAMAPDFLLDPAFGLAGGCWTLDTGRSATASIGCVPNWPDPTITATPTEGEPFTTTNKSAGPGARIAGLGGN